MPGERLQASPIMVYLPKELADFVKREAIADALDTERSVSLSRWLVDLVQKEYEKRDKVTEQ